MPKADGQMYDQDTTYPGVSRTVANISSAADRGSLHASANSIYEYDFQQSSDPNILDKVVTTAQAKVTLDDVVISGPATAATVSTSINMHIDGNVISSSTTSPGSNNVFASSSVSTTLLFDNTSDR